ncbi:MAG: bacterial Ig-like domain-containing protein, partial [Treponema sp.]
VTATYSDSTTGTIANSECTFTGYDMATAGTQTVTVAYSELTATYDITVQSANTESIAITTPATKTSFTVGDTFDSTGIAVTYTDTNNATSDVTSSCVFSGYDMATAGTQTVTATYNTLTATYSILVVNAIPYSVSGAISASTEVKPVAVTSTTGASVSFWLGTDLASDWTTVIKTVQGSIQLSTLGYYPDGTWKTNWFESAATSSNGGAYKSYFNAASYVTVSFNTDNTITFYKNGVLLFTYASTTTGNDDTSCAISNLCSAVISDLAKSGFTLNPDESTAETADVTVTMYDAYVNSSVDATSAVSLYTAALNTVSSISINTDAATTTFAKDSTFSLSGIVVTATTASGFSFIVNSADYTVDSSAVTMSAAGTYDVTVKVGSNASKTYSVTVNAATLSSIAVKTAPKDSTYYLNDNINAAGLVITATYSDSTTSDIAYDNDSSSFTFSGFDSSAVATGQNITVTYGEKTTTFNVDIVTGTEVANISFDYTAGITDDFVVYAYVQYGTYKVTVNGTSETKTGSAWWNADNKYTNYTLADGSSVNMFIVPTDVNTLVLEGHDSNTTSAQYLDYNSYDGNAWGYGATVTFNLTKAAWAQTAGNRYKATVSRSGNVVTLVVYDKN